MKASIRLSNYKNVTIWMTGNLYAEGDYWVWWNELDDVVKGA